MNAQLGLEGRYKFITHKADADGNVIPGTAKVALDWFDNLITDTGLDLLGQNANDNLVHCRLGTGNTEPAFTDSTLVAQVGSSSTGGLGAAHGLSVDQTYRYRRVSRRFAAGTVAGQNLAEVGMSQAATGNNIFSRALLRDTGGAPTTITLAADEVLDVVYELRMYLPAQGTTVTATVDGVETTITMMYSTVANVVSAGAAGLGMGLRKLIEAGKISASEYAVSPGASFYPHGQQFSITPVFQPYVAGSYTLTFSVSLGLTQANYPTGVGTIGFGTDERYTSDANSTGAWGWGFSPKLNKTSSRTATATLGLAWGRYTP